MPKQKWPPFNRQYRNFLYSSSADSMPSDPKTGAMREKLNQIPYDLFPFEEVVPAFCAVAEFGAMKYELWNWSKGLSRVQLASSAARHLFAMLRGKKFDDGPKGSGLPHSYHLLWNAAVIVHNEHWGLADGIRGEPVRPYHTTKPTKGK